MRFIVDECTGPSVAQWLKGKGFEVYSVYPEHRGSGDEVILAKAYLENWIVINNDKDFGELAYKQRMPHHGIILLRLNDERVENKIAVLDILISRFSETLVDNFTVVSENSIRILGQKKK